MTKFHFGSTYDSKEISLIATSTYAAMLMMTSQVLNSVNFTKTQKPRYLENKTLFFLEIRKFINYRPRAILRQKIVLLRMQSISFHDFLEKDSVASVLHQDIRQLATECLNFPMALVPKLLGKYFNLETKYLTI